MKFSLNQILFPNSTLDYFLNFSNDLKVHAIEIRNDIKTNKEPNGCHFGWSNELFLFITGLDREITKKEEKKLKHIRNS